ncbi:GntR family transcriptional regulator [Streptomyces albiaxialis]|uniref:GntR family transcriptional regulator n=1 Tax=Streptomyces albiaxialis TaxID=329523 RepID=A0ABP5HPS9_9ACTN
MEQTRAEPSIRAAVRPAPRERAVPRVPEQAAARGEHIHSEPPPPGAPSPGVSSSGARAPQRHSVRAQILDALRGALASGELAPGEVYSAPALAARFGVSPTPVREAMQQLASEGAVETIPNRGFRVAEHSPRDRAELAEVRAMLEVPAVLRLARTVPSERWEELRPAAEATLEAAARGDRAAYAAADRGFHRAVLELTGNRQLVAVVEDVNIRAQRFAMLAAKPVSGVAELLAEAADHLALLDALAARDLPAVESLTRHHYA